MVTWVRPVVQDFYKIGEKELFLTIVKWTMKFQEIQTTAHTVRMIENRTIMKGLPKIKSKMVEAVRLQKLYSTKNHPNISMI